MKIKLTPVVLAAMLLCMSIPSVKSNPLPFDKTLSFTGVFSLINPCNGESITGPIDVYIVVTTAQTGNGNVKVNVHHNSHGTLSGNLGNDYQVSRRSKGQFDAISTSYVINWTGEFVGTGSAPNFTADGTLRVFVNSENEPTGSNLVMMSTQCKED